MRLFVLKRVWRSFWVDEQFSDICLLTQRRSVSRQAWWPKSQGGAGHFWADLCREPDPPWWMDSASSGMSHTPGWKVPDTQNIHDRSHAQVRTATTQTQQTRLVRSEPSCLLRLTPCSLILSVSHLSSLRYSRREASAARSITKANGVPFSSMDKDWQKLNKRLNGFSGLCGFISYFVSFTTTSSWVNLKKMVLHRV